MRTRRLKDGRTITARQNGGIRKRCGCPRSAWTKTERCPHPWHANVSHAGVEHRVSLHKWAKKPAGYVMLQGEAKSLFRDWQNEIEGKAAPVIPDPVVPDPGPTFDAIAESYITEYVKQPDRRKPAQKEMERLVEVLRKAFGVHAATAITKVMIEDFRTARRQAFEAGAAAVAQVAALKAAEQPVPKELHEQAQRAAMSTKAGRVSTNRLLARMRHVYVWAIERDLLESSPFSKGSVSVIKLDRKAEGSRSRRLEDDENDRLLAKAGTHLRACIEATLETGMRRGEILGLKWADVRLSRGIIELPTSITKTGIARVVAISPRLKLILEMRRTAADGEEHPPTAFVFGNECGEQVKTIKTAWRLTCKRAGITGLRFHDLRREAGSRMIEAPGVSLTDVRDFLGHRYVGQTNVYLATTAQRLRAAIEKRDTARTNLAQTETPPVEAALRTH